MLLMSFCSGPGNSTSETGDTVLTVVIILLILLGVCLLLFAGVAVYALILMKKKSPLALYEARTRQADYLPLSAVPARQVQLLVELEDSDFYTHRGVSLFEIRSAVQLNLSAKKIVYGGSTIILLLQRDRVVLRDGLTEATLDGRETPVKLGERIGAAPIKDVCSANRFATI